jgi:hypothetical protein
MKITRIGAFIAVLVLTLSFLPALQAADKSDWPTMVTLDRPISIGNIVLDPGTYQFQLASNMVDRNILSIYSVDKRQWNGFVMGNTAYRSNDTVEFIFAAGAGKNGSDSLSYWFFPGNNRGIQFRH